MLADSQGNGVSLLGFKGGGLRHLTACKILKPPLYKLHLTPFPEGEPQLFLSAFLADEVSCAESRQQGDATTEGGVSVVIATVERQTRGGEGRFAASLKVASVLIDGIAVVAAVLTMEHAAALGERGHGQSEDEGEGDCEFFHRCICRLINFVESSIC